MDVEKRNKGIKIAIIVAIIVLVIIVLVDVFKKYVDTSTWFTTTNITKTEKEVTVTDTGISDAVDKLYDATVIVEVGTSSSSLTGWGSGCVYKVDGNTAYILTNYHVVTGSSYISIVYTDDSTTTGTYVGGDEYADVAVIKVDAKTIKAVAEIGSSSSVKLGDTVFAIGTPVSLSYKFSVTRGILSGKDRLVSMSSSSSQSSYGFSTSESWYMNLLQIDASINSGNSGGPLANSNGQVIGITNSKLSNAYSSTSIENMGFAVPIEDAVMVADQVISTGKVTRPFLGLSMTTVDQASRYNIDVGSADSGAVVVEVQSGSAAEHAGLKSGDIITKFGDYDISDYKYLKYYLYRYKVGDSVTITYTRNGEEHTTDITLTSN